MFKLLILAGAIFLAYRWISVPSISSPKEEDKDDYIDYEEVD